MSHLDIAGRFIKPFVRNRASVSRGTDQITVTGELGGIAAGALIRCGRYAESRKPDPRIATAIERELGPARSILNVGAGSGSYLGRDAEAGLSRLAGDLESGEWERRYADILALDEYNAGYRLVISP